MWRILLLDPYPKRRQKLAFLLRHSGFIVELGEGGIEATTRLERTQPDMVLVSEHCPTLQDREAARLAFGLFDNVPKIVLGEEAEEVAGIPYLELGADAYLPKPLNTRVLLARVRSMMHRYERTRESDCEAWVPSTSHSETVRVATGRGVNSSKRSAGGPGSEWG